MARTERGRERKQQLVDAAAALFADRGYEDTRIVDIVHAAGVAKGLFYWYFENKEALFAEVADDITNRFDRALADTVDPTADPLTQLRQGTETGVRFWVEHARFFSLLEPDVAGAAPPAGGSGPRGGVPRRRGTDEQTRAVRRIIERGQRDGLVVDDDPDLLTFGVVGTIGLYSFFHRAGGRDTDVDELAAFVGRLVIRMLAVPGALPGLDGPDR